MNLKLTHEMNIENCDECHLKKEQEDIISIIAISVKHLQCMFNISIKYISADDINNIFLFYQILFKTLYHFQIL